MTPIDKYSNHTYSYLHLRKAVGWIGVLLPFVLVLGTNFIFNQGYIQESISHYYHTGMSDVFVGTICAIALFMFYYSGYDQWDNIAGNIAGFGALGVALFPTTASGPVDLIGKVHYAAAIVLFVTLAVFCLWLFRKGKPGVKPTPQKIKRNFTYLACGIIIIACLAAIAIFQIYFVKDPNETFFVFAAETVALLAFGFSWLVKGGALMADK